VERLSIVAEQANVEVRRGDLARKDSENKRDNRLGLDTDQGNSQVVSFLPAQMRNRLPDCDFESRPHGPRKEMAAAQGTIV
jgi:hypothetical protein